MHKFPTSNSNFEKKIIISDMHHRITYMYINFQQHRISNPWTQIYLQKNRKLHKFATTNSKFAKSIISDMNHRITYMYVNFQHNRVGRQIKTVHTNLLAKQCRLHKFTTCNSNFEKSRFSDMHCSITNMQAN